MNLVDLAEALALGLLLGAITGMPLGVVNVAIVDAVIAHERRHALGLGIGGALADATHTLLAFIGLGRLVTARPQYARWLALIAAAAIVVFAIASWRRRRVDTKAPEKPSFARGLASGVALTLFNPAALAAWVAVAAMTGRDATIAVAISVAIGVGVGSAAWFTALGSLVAKVPPDHRALRIVPRVALVLFVAIALGGAIRAF